MLPADLTAFTQYTFRKASAQAPEISVIIPVYNRARTIMTCLEQLSLSDYDVNKIQVIVVDDASSDGSYEVLHRYAAMFPHIITLQRGVNSKGASVPRNDAMAVASGKWILFVDSDDYIMPNAISDALAVVHADSLVDMVCMPFFKAEGSTRATSDSAFDSADTVTGLAFEQTRLCNSLNAVGKVMRADFIRQYGIDFPADIRVREDNWFMMKMYSVCRNIAILGNRKKYYFVSDSDAVSLSRTGTPPADAVKIYLSVGQFILGLGQLSDQEKYTLLAIYLNRYTCFIQRGTHAPLRLLAQMGETLPLLLSCSFLNGDARTFIHDLLAGKYALS